MKKPPLIPLRNGAIVVPDGRKIINNYASVPPSYTMYPYECVRLNIPDLVVADEYGRLEVAFKPVKALRIYCRHDITEERHNSGDINGGVGTEEDPFQNFWKAVDFANCLSQRMCQWVQLIIDSEKPITIFGNTSEIIALDGEFLVIGDLDESIRFTSLVPLYSRMNDLNRSPIIASADLKYKKDYLSPAFPYGGYRKLIKVNAEVDKISCQQYVECDIKAESYVYGASGVNDGDRFSGKAYSTSISAQIVYISHMTKVTFISTESMYSESFFSSSSRFVYDCKITGPNHWERGFGGAEFSAHGAIHKSNIDRYHILAGDANIMDLDVNHGYISANSEDTVIDGLRLNLEVLVTEENVGSYIRHAGNIGGVVNDVSITQNIRIGALRFGAYSNPDRVLIQDCCVSLGDNSVARNVTVNTTVTLLESIVIPERYTESGFAVASFESICISQNNVAANNVSASIVFENNSKLKNYCFYIRDLGTADKCEGNWYVEKKGSTPTDCTPNCEK